MDEVFSCGEKQKHMGQCEEVVVGRLVNRRCLSRRGKFRRETGAMVTDAGGKQGYWR